MALIMQLRISTCLLCLFDIIKEHCLFVETFTYRESIFNLLEVTENVCFSFLLDETWGKQEKNNLRTYCSRIIEWKFE